MESLCTEVLTDGTVKAFPAESYENCTFVILSTDDYTSALSANLVFDIDSNLYVEITGYLLLSFVSGHVLGRIVKGLSRA